jgi:hypothetical protein
VRPPGTGELERSRPRSRANTCDEFKDDVQPFLDGDADLARVANGQQSGNADRFCLVHHCVSERDRVRAAEGGAIGSGGPIVGTGFRSSSNRSSAGLMPVSQRPLPKVPAPQDTAVADVAILRAGALPATP